PVFGIMMIGLQMSFVVVTIGYTLTAAGFPARSLGVNVVKSALNVVGDLILIPILGFIGPALAGAIASYVANPIGVWLLRRSDIAIEVRSYVKQTLILLVCAGLFWWLQPSRIFDRTAILALFLLLSFAL